MNGLVWQDLRVSLASQLIDSKMLLFALAERANLQERSKGDIRGGGGGGGVDGVDLSPLESATDDGVQDERRQCSFCLGFNKVDSAQAAVAMVASQ